MDDLDMALIRAIIESGNSMTSTEAARALLGPKDRHELRNVDGKIRYRLRGLMRDGILTKNGSHYTLADRVGVFPEIHLADPTHSMEWVLPKVALIEAPRGFYIVSYNQTKKQTPRTPEETRDKIVEDVRQKIEAGGKAAWLAGLIDGEGCFTVVLNHTKYFQPRFQIGMTHRATMEEVKRIVGQGHFTIIEPKGVRRRAFSLYLENPRHVLGLVLAVRPWLITKAAEADVIAQACWSRIQHPGNSSTGPHDLSVFRAELQRLKKPIP